MRKRKAIHLKKGSLYAVIHNSLSGFINLNSENHSAANENGGLI